MAGNKITVTHTGSEVPAHTKIKAGNNPKSSTGEDYRWWHSEGQGMAEKMLEVINTLSRAQKSRIQSLAACSRLYGDIPQSNSYGMMATRLSPSHPAASRNQPITYNAVQIATDTSTCHVAKTKPKPYFLTKGAKFKTKRKAKKLNQFIDGVFYSAKVNTTAPLVYRDALVWGTGATHVYAEHGEVCIERVPAYELWVDTLEASTGNPRQLYRVKLVDRDVLADLFPSKRTEIQNSHVFQMEGVLSGTVNNLTAVLEGWHLPSGPDATDGKHSLIVSNGVLVDEKYEKPYFPFSFLRWSPPQTGFWGIGAVEQARATQLEINQTCWVIQMSHKKGGSSKIWLEEGSNIVEDHLTNDIWSIGWYRGTPPTYITPTFCPAETYQHLDRLKTTVFDIFGVNQLSARSAKPEGLESGAALREYRDQTSERLIIPSSNYDQWHLDTAKLCLDAIKEITEETGNYKVRVPGKKFLSEMDWKSINLDDEEYEIQCYPISQLPDDPAGRLQTATEWAQAGLITQRQLRRVLDFPDIQSLESLQASSDDYLEYILDMMVDEGKYTAPEVYDDIDAGMEMATELYEQGKTSGLEEERLELLRRFIKQCQWQKQQAMPPPAPIAGPAAGAAPMGKPAPAPTSDLLPFAGAAPQ